MIGIVCVSVVLFVLLFVLVLVIYGMLSIINKRLEYSAEFYCFININGKYRAILASNIAVIIVPVTNHVTKHSQCIRLIWAR